MNWQIILKLSFICGLSHKNHTVFHQLISPNIFLQGTLLLLSLAVFFSYALQFYVLMEILGPNVLRPRVSEEWYNLTEFFVRDHP